MSTISLLELATRFAHASHAVRDSQADIEAVAEVVERSAKSFLGNSNNPLDLAPLAESTVERKGSDLIGEDTGELKRSISRTIGHHEAWIGTDLERGVAFEFGTSRQPPRPIFGPAANEGQGALILRTQKRLDRAFKGHGHGGGHDDLKHALHAIGEILEFGKKLVE